MEVGIWTKDGGCRRRLVPLAARDARVAQTTRDCSRSPVLVFAAMPRSPGLCRASAGSRRVQVLPMVNATGVIDAQHSISAAPSPDTPSSMATRYAGLSSAVDEAERHLPSTGRASDLSAVVHLPDEIDYRLTEAPSGETIAFSAAVGPQGSLRGDGHLQRKARCRRGPRCHAPVCRCPAVRCRRRTVLPISELVESRESDAAFGKCQTFLHGRIRLCSAAAL